MRTTVDILSREELRAKAECKQRLENTLRYCGMRSFQQQGFKAYIYVIQCQGFVKIGIADNPKKRLSELQVGCPFKLELVRAFASRDPRRDEKSLHHSLGKHHERGEWFRLTDPLSQLLTHWAKGAGKLGHSK